MISIDIQKNISLKGLTTYKIGGKAEFFAEIKTREELKEARKWAMENNHKITVISGGSNILFNDNGINGLLLKVANANIKAEGDSLITDAGADLMHASRVAADNSLSGLEWAVDVPGSVGGAIRGNAGAYGSSIAQNLIQVEYFDLEIGEFEFLSANKFSFSYKESVFKQNKSLIIWRAEFNLVNDDKMIIQEKMSEYARSREATQPKLPSAGCVFKNLEFKKIKISSPQLAQLAEANGCVKGGKISAGWVVDLLGFKGATHGKAKVSLEHANFIVNIGGAVADDVRFLVEAIQRKAHGQFGLEMELEIEVV